MTTGLKLRLSPKDHGRPLTLDEFFDADSREGYQYELIDGRVYVSPMPDPPENVVDIWIFSKLLHYSRQRPDITNYVTNKARIIIPGRPGATAPEPDLAAYRNFPLDRPFRTIRWREVSPILVGEVLSLGDPDKDLVRNVELYWQVPTIKEYWLIDTRESPDQPTLSVYRRAGSKWRILEFGFGGAYTTKLLPGFKLIIDPRK